MKTNVGGSFGACIVKGDKLISMGSNHVLSGNDPTAHAEILSIRNACKNIHSYDLRDCELYTSCYPCPMCLSAIIWANIKKVYYGNTKEDANSIGFRYNYIYDFIKKIAIDNNDNNILELKCINRQETIGIFSKFIIKSNRIVY